MERRLLCYLDPNAKIQNLHRRGCSSVGRLTDTLLAGVGQVVVARYIAPVAAVVPHHHCAVLAGQEVAVRLASVPVLIELTQRRDGIKTESHGGKQTTLNTAALTRGFPSDQRKSPSMVLSFSPIH